MIFDPVGGDVFDQSTRCVAQEGRILVIGFTSGRIPNVQVNRLLLKNISIVGVLWGDYANSRPWYLGEVQRALAGLLAERKIDPVVSHEYPLSDAPGDARCSRAPRDGQVGPHNFMIKTVLPFVLMALAPTLMIGANDAVARLDAAASVFTEIMSAPDKGVPQDLLDKSECIVIVPT